MNNYVLIVLSCLLIVACGQENNIIDVSPEFEPYVQEFIEEAAKRGQTIDFSDTGLQIEFSNVALLSSSGFCRSNEHYIAIDKAQWFSTSERIRSWLIFHELGHCELDRPHRTELFNNSTWKSIMWGAPLTTLEKRIPIPFFGFRKKYYIDELFDPNISTPEWSQVQYDFDEPHDRNLIVEKDNISRINERFSTALESYEIETTFKLTTGPNHRTRFEWGSREFSYYINVVDGWQGLRIGVQEDGADNNLFYSHNISLVNGKPIEKITVRQADGVEQVFINDSFIFHLDALPDLDFSRLETTANGTFISDFVVESYVVNEL